MKIFTHPLQKYNTDVLKEVFENNNPIPWISIDNFLDGEMVKSLKGELDYEYCHNPEKHKMFTRAGSNMFEVLHNHELKYAHELISHVHSAPFLKFLEGVTGFRGLICDPYLTGAGYMRCGEGDSLKIHTDFNWNDQLYLHRALSVIFYLNPVWDETWNGDLQLWDKERNGKVHSIFPGNGNMLIWKYDKLGYHGHPNPIKAPTGHYRDGFRFFFYVSSSEYKKDDLPHRSLYYYDDKNNIPVDKS